MSGGAFGVRMIIEREREVEKEKETINIRTRDFRVVDNLSLLELARVEGEQSVTSWN